MIRFTLEEVSALQDWMNRGFEVERDDNIGPVDANRLALFNMVMMKLQSRAATSDSVTDGGTRHE